MVAKELRSLWWMLAFGMLMFMPVLVSGPTPYPQLVEVARMDNNLMAMHTPSIYEQDTGVPMDPVLFAAEEMALFFGSTGKTFLIPLAAVLGVGLVSTEAGRGTIFLLLSKPIGRGQVLLTKWAVGALALLAISAFFGVAFVASAAAKGYPLDSLSPTGVALSILLLWLGSLSVLGLALALSALMRNALWSVLAVLSLLVAIWVFFNFLSGLWMEFFLSSNELSVPIVQRVIIPYYWSSKDLYLGDSLALVNFAVCLFTAALALFAALWVFRRKEY